MKKYLIAVALVTLLFPGTTVLAQTANQNSVLYEAMLNQVIQLQLKLIGMLRGLPPSAIPTSLDLTSIPTPAVPARPSADNAWQWKYFADQNVFLFMPTDWDEALEGLGNDAEGDAPTVTFGDNTGLRNPRIDYDNCSRDTSSVEAGELTVGNREYCAVEITEDEGDTTSYRKLYITEQGNDYIMISFEVEYDDDNNSRRDDTADDAEDLFDRIITSATYGRR